MGQGNFEKWECGVRVGGGGVGMRVRVQQKCM